MKVHCAACGLPVENRQVFSVFCDECRPVDGSFQGTGGVDPVENIAMDRAREAKERIKRRAIELVERSTAPDPTSPDVPTHPPADLRPSDLEMPLLFEQVVRSEYVVRGGHEGAAGRTLFEYKTGGLPPVDARTSPMTRSFESPYATMVINPEYGKNPDGPDRLPLIVVPEGFIVAAEQIALRTPVDGFPVPGTLKEFVEGQLAGDDPPLLPDLGRGAANVYSAQASLLRAMVLDTIAHEMGHIALRHVGRFFAPGGRDLSKDTLRNQERQADLFASSVIAESPYAKMRLQGRLVKLLLFAYHRKNAPPLEEQYRSHPEPYERLANTVRENEVAAAKIGIAEAWIKQLAHLDRDPR